MSSLPENIYVATHPVLNHKVTQMRSSVTNSSVFRQCMHEITYFLGFEATRDLQTKTVAISVPIPNTSEHLEAQGDKLATKVAFVPVLRSGLGMMDPMLELLPHATVHHIGMYKTLGQTQPIMYFNRLPRQCTSDIAYILDPVIATSETTKSCIKILKKWGVPKIHVITVIASRSGLEQIHKDHPDVSITLGCIDEEVTAKGVLVPGLGDAGDRLFGTVVTEEDEEALVHTSKRKRGDSVVSKDENLS